MKNTPKISAIIQTLNEEKNIANCLESLNWVDEIVVVDMYSDDRTVEIAQRYTKHIYSHPRTGIVEPARQFALEQASNNWVLVVDADEMISYNLSKVLLDIITEDRADVVAIPRANYFFGHKMQQGKWSALTDLQYRCFKKDHLVQWTHLIHRTPSFTPESRGIRLTNDAAAIIHFNYTDITQYLEKMDRYTNVIASQWVAGETSMPAELEALINQQEKLPDGQIGGIVDHLTNTHFMIAALKYYLMKSYQSNDITAGVNKIYQSIADKTIAEYGSNDKGSAPSQMPEIDYEQARRHNSLAEVLYRQGKLKDALLHVEKALEIDSDYYDAKFGRSNILLKQGNLADGFSLYECRLQRPEFNFLHNHTLWDGNYFGGKRLLVCAEQGFGDNLQFIRYLPLVKARGGHVTLSAKPELLRLFSKLSGVDEVIEHKRTENIYDYIIPLLSLPRIFGTTLNTIPATVPYLSIDQQLINKWGKRITSSDYKIGLVWAGKTHYMPERSMHLQELAPLADISGVTFYSLQKTGAAQQTQPPQGMNWIDLSLGFEDFADTAAAIMQLDLVISVDTSVAHLAGALGKPVFLLLPAHADWRWLMNRGDSPWYPTMRLFRQTTSGNWQDVITKVFHAVVSLSKK